MKSQKYKSIKILIGKTKNNKLFWIKKERPVRKLNNGSYGIVYNGSVYRLYEPNKIFTSDRKYNKLDCIDFVYKSEKLIFDNLFPNEIKIYKNNSLMDYTLSKRPIRIIFDGLYGVVYQKKVFPLINNKKIDISGASYEKNDCLGFH